MDSKGNSINSIDQQVLNINIQNKSLQLCYISQILNNIVNLTIIQKEININNNDLSFEFNNYEEKEEEFIDDLFDSESELSVEENITFQIPIVKYPTINNIYPNWNSVKVKTPIIKLNNILINNNDCTICFDNYIINDNIFLINNCQHNFHKECLKKWIIHKGRLICPLCKIEGLG